MNKKGIRVVFAVLSGGLAVCMLCLCVCAEESVPEQYKEFLESLPSDTSQMLPDGIFSSDADSVSDAVSQMSGIEYLFSSLMSSFGVGIRKVIPHAAVLICVLVLSSVLCMISSHLSVWAGRALDMCSRLAIFGSVGGIAVSVLGDVKQYLVSLCTAVTSFIPLSSVLYTMGGNVGTALKTSSSLMATLGVVEAVSGVIVVPLFCFCLCMSLVSCMGKDIGSFSLGGAVKKSLLSVLGVICTLLSLSLSSQTVIASRSDSLAMRGAKVFLGSIPVTGGAVSSSAGTIASSISLIRSSVGMGGIIIILLLLLPTLIEVWLIKVIYSLLGGVSGMLGMSGEQKLLLEVSELYGILEGVALMCSAVFIVAMALLCSVPVALG